MTNRVIHRPTGRTGELLWLGFTGTPAGQARVLFDDGSRETVAAVTLGDEG